MKSSMLFTKQQSTMKESNCIIRTESPQDFPKVYNVNVEAFGRSDEAQLVDRLRSGNSFIEELSLVACVDNKVVGHILFSKIVIVDGQHRNESLALAPMAVVPELQNRGIGTQLIQEGLKKAKSLGHHSVIVLGHDKFYPKFDFVPTNKWNIKAPFNVPSTSFMGLELDEGAFEDVQGVVQYPDVFEI